MEQNYKGQELSMILIKINAVSVSLEAILKKIVNF